MDTHIATSHLLREIALRIDVDRLRQIRGGSILAEALQRFHEQSTGSWTDHTKHSDTPSWANYSAHAKTIKK